MAALISTFMHRMLTFIDFALNFHRKLTLRLFRNSGLFA